MNPAQLHLSRVDPRLADIIKRYPERPIVVKGSPFYTLVESVVHQQLSVRVAATIWQRFIGLFEQQVVSASALLKLSDESLRGAGLSRQKVKYVRAVAEFSLAGGLALDYLRGQSDQAIISELTQIYGVGAWTVEMMLITAMGRPDVFACDDLVIQQAMCQLYSLGNPKGKARKQALMEIAAPWAPYRTTACQYLWVWKHETDLAQRSELK